MFRAQKQQGQGSSGSEAQKYIFWAWSEDFVFIILATQFPYN